MPESLEERPSNLPNAFPPRLLPLRERGVRLHRPRKNIAAAAAAMMATPPMTPPAIAPACDLVEASDTGAGVMDDAAEDDEEETDEGPTADV